MRNPSHVSYMSYEEAKRAGLSFKLLSKRELCIFLDEFTGACNTLED